jgi:hypothetical protein
MAHPGDPDMDASWLAYLIQGSHLLHRLLDQPGLAEAA